MEDPNPQDRGVKPRGNDGLTAKPKGLGTKIFSPEGLQRSGCFVAAAFTAAADHRACALAGQGVGR